MLKYLKVSLGQPMPLPGGSLVKEFIATEDTTIQRVPPADWPAKLVVVGPWGQIDVDWAGNVVGHQTIDVVGPQPYTETSIEKASEFLIHLEESDDERRYLFRGLPRASYDLIPSAVRLGRLPTTGEQFRKEAWALVHFGETLRDQGLPIPNRPAVVTFIKEIRGGAQLGVVWPAQPLYEFMGIAQHFGVPTRLLDWAQEPSVAAYFAASLPGSADEPMAVWILDTAAYKHFAPIGTTANTWIGTPIAVDYASNPNAHAQRGVFTMHSPIYDYDRLSPPGAETLDVYLSKHSVTDPPGGLRKISLPASERGSLLKILHRRRIDGATMFPGYYGATQMIKERAIWDPLP